VDIGQRYGDVSVMICVDPGQMDPTVLAVATTGSVGGSSTDELLEHGFARALRKPFLLHELDATIVLPRGRDRRGPAWA
jgi:hypothetical protein